jgi:pimeloyl-ACP methyl ester carboxylesterase
MMQIRLILGSIFFISVVAFLCFYQGKSKALAANDEYKLIKKSCEFSVDWQANITCAELQVPQRRGGFVIKVAILRDGSRMRRSDPVVYLQGGPGMAAGINKAGIARWLRWMELAQLQRDIILIDPRGTGSSWPKLECADFNRFNQQLLKQSLALDDELLQSRKITAQCFTMLERKGVSAQQFGSAQSAQDVRALMSLLKYAEWNILAVSYGTRLALEIARQEELERSASSLKSMVLDSVYPAGYGGMMTWPEVLDTAMQQFFNGCKSFPACAELLPHLGAQSLQQILLDELLELQQHPLMLTIRRWDGEPPIDFMLNDHRLLSASFAAIYTPEQWPVILEALIGLRQLRVQESGSKRAYRDAIKALVGPYLNRSFSEDFNSLTFSAVDCADNPLGTAAAYDANVAKFPVFEGYTKGQWLNQVCQDIYSAASLPLALQIPKVPSLLLAGALDPVTPSSWAIKIQQQWLGAQLVLRPHVAHSVLASDRCLLQQLSDFFDKPSQQFIACLDPVVK